MNALDVKTVSSDEIPVIDIGPLVDGSDPMVAARDLTWAATEVGFIYVRNHGIDDAVIETARQAGLAFFRQPLERKLEVVTNRHHHGYLRPGATKMYDDAHVDLKESYNFGIDLDDATLARHTDNGLLGRNEWPAYMPALREALYPYFEAASACAETLLRGFALGAGKPADVFTRSSDLPITRGSLQYYPPRPDDLSDDHFSLAPHTDFGMLTVLAQDAVGGLQIQAMDGTWIAAPPIPGTLVVNVGDLLGRWSNDTYRSTPHRVINSSGRERLSLVLAYDPNHETVVDSKLFCSDGEAPKYEPITCGDYLTWRFEKAFAYRGGAQGANER
jgi:isopenicillin N synthase-like dioxygenase